MLPTAGGSFLAIGGFLRFSTGFYDGLLALLLAEALAAGVNMFS